MKKLLALILAVILILALITAYAAESAPTAGTLLVVSNTAYAPMYASYSNYDSTVITYIPRGETVMYISAVPKGYCVAYQNFVGYVSSAYLAVVSDTYYRFRLPDGSSYRQSAAAATPTPTPTPTPTVPSYAPGGGYWGGYWEYDTYVPDFKYTAKKADPNQRLATHSGPGTYYTDTGIYSQYNDISVYYQTEGDSTTWGYIELVYKNRKYRVYTPSYRYAVNEYVETTPESTTEVTISRDVQLYYGPGYDYGQGSYELLKAGSKVKAYFEENGWVMVEYRLKSGTRHRGWAPSGFWY